MFTTLLSALVCFGLCQQLQSATDTPDPGAKPLSNTADGTNALLSITTGLYNSAFGFDSLLSTSDASFDTGIGAGALLLDTGGTNTAVGAGALLSNTTAGDNTAVGTFAMFVNSTGADNTAVGASAMLNNVDGFQNTVVGAGAGPNLVTTAGSFNTYLGQFVGSTIPEETSTIRIADISIDGFGSAECFIGGIFNNFQPVGGSVVEVTLDLNDDHLGWDVGPSQGAPSVPSRGAPAQRGKGQPAARPQRPADPHQAMLNDKVEKLQVVVQLQQKQIGALTAQLKEQAAQIQKVSAQVEMSKPAAKVVVNKP